MFEFDKYEKSLASPVEKSGQTIEYATGISRRSLLFWSEHCIECAAPDCYQSCDLYKSRPDERCRRFDYGMRRNRHFRGSSGSSAEIVFGRWGKLETRGNTVMLPAAAVKLLESTLYLLVPVVNAVGKLVRRFGGSPPWSALTFELQDIFAKRLQRRTSNENPPDGFLIEIFNPMNHGCRLKFATAVDSSTTRKSKRAVPLPFWALIELHPGYNRCLVDYSAMRTIVESGLPYNISLTPDTESGMHLVFITLDFVAMNSSDLPEEKIIPKQIGMKPSIPDVKCVVFDLDDTLWSGVLVEGEVSLKPGIIDLFEALDKRGILISVVSKNNEHETLAKLESLGLREYLIQPAINWAQKSDNLKWIASTISLGTDTFLFVDDNPFEREEVSSVLPEVEVLPETEIAHLLNHPRLAGSNTVESRNRRVMYQQQILREEAVVEYGNDYVEFLKQCQIELFIERSNEANRDRVIELLQRTNQLNFSGRKYTRDEIRSLLQDVSLEKHVIHCKDKFGDYGIVGFSLTHTQEDCVTVQDFMLSCRVQGKLIEKAFFNYLVKTAIQDRGTLVVNFVPGQRNLPAKNVLQKLGFNLVDGDLSTLAIEPDCLAVDFLTVNTESVRNARTSIGEQDENPVIQ